MIKESAIVFTATFLGVVTAILTFNQLIENRLLPARVSSLVNATIESTRTQTQKLESAVAGLAAEPVKHTRLDDVIDEALKGSKGKYAIAIKNLKTGETYYKNPDEEFESASLYKLWIMGTTYKQIKEGVINEDDTLSADVATLNKQFAIASESAERTEGGISLTVGSALQQMITISHNYAALLLTAKVKLANVRAYLIEKQLVHSKTGSPPKTTAADTLLFFEKLYKGQLAEPEYTVKMLDLLKRQKLNNKLPKYLPAGTVVAHKTGELGAVSHDAGIVYTPNGDYIIVVLSESSAPTGAEERIAQISKGVYEYFTAK